MQTVLLRQRSRLSLERLGIQGSRIALLALVLGFGLGAVAGWSLSLEAQLLVYLVGMIGLNLPHGGYEHVVNLRGRGVRFGVRYVALYLLCLAAFVAAFFLTPIVALGIGFTAAIAKAGYGDLRVLDAIAGRNRLEGRPRRTRRILAGFVRGGSVLIVPLLAHPGPFYGTAAYIASVVDPGAAVVLRESLPAVRLLVGAVFGTAIVGYVTLGTVDAIRSLEREPARSRSWLSDAAETTLLLTYFVVVPPIVAVGLYFPLWYSLRQLARERLATRPGPNAVESSRRATAGAVLAVGAATAAVAGLLWILVPNPLGGGELLPGLVAFYTLFVCLIALPHVAVGEWFDRRGGIWYVRQS
ncbi:Brp/Blh family beta-carotene 15,15'-dioxygenase [Halopiger aswanensis]|uniref:Brp/Blh family beta-carotene 15,15'-monooxygenase n=1 Tax=Halopiger aswanensis TaxID=148449 RepID=A0A3R7HYY4_9EURY|nr:Brp/Blh family beta-carotene 15,15'-dioxygenase [Halopiger aswanensis]RKD97164.1 Brp/Blh family beta-carotene 15,15'-monooxygenase [Halopiger aswanensis]